MPVIIEMVSATRLDCAISSAGLMRRAVAEAIHHARHRAVFGKKLIDQPLMWQVLADLVLDVEAATALVFRLARACDRQEDERARAWLRLMTPVTKYWVCKLAPGFVYEAMECLGGNGYVEEGMLARIYREVPVNAIWEGSGNVMALDLFRVLQREPDVAAMALEDLGAGVGEDRTLAAAFAQVQSILHEPRTLDLRARALVEGLARVAAGALLRAHAPAAVADAYHRHAARRRFPPDLGPGPRKGRLPSHPRPRVAPGDLTSQTPEGRQAALVRCEFASKPSNASTMADRPLTSSDRRAPRAFSRRSLTRWTAGSAWRSAVWPAGVRRTA